MFTQLIGMDVAEAVGARCVVAKWAPDLPTGEWPPFGQPGLYPSPGLQANGARHCWYKCRHYQQLLEAVMVRHPFHSTMN